MSLSVCSHVKNCTDLVLQKIRISLVLLSATGQYRPMLQSNVERDNSGCRT